MYNPPHFSQKEYSAVRSLIEQNGFVCVLSFPKDDRPFINHLPIVFSPHKNEETVLLGHMAKRNPQWGHFKENPECTMIVNGGHTYITPSWYRSGRDVPTWNYAVAHLHGKIELVENFAQQIEILKSLTEFYERPNPKPWEFELPDDLQDPDSLTSAIISFKFHIQKTEAKFKLSQNRSQEDRASVIEGLRSRDDDMSRNVRELMLKNER